MGAAPVLEAGRGLGGLSGYGATGDWRYHVIKPRPVVYRLIGGVGCVGRADGQTGRQAGRQGNAAWSVSESGVRWMREVKRNARLVDMGGRGFYAASRLAPWAAKPQRRPSPVQATQTRNS